MIINLFLSKSAIDKEINSAGGEPKHFLVFVSWCEMEKKIDKVTAKIHFPWKMLTIMQCKIYNKLYLFPFEFLRSLAVHFVKCLLMGLCQIGIEDTHIIIANPMVMKY